MPTSSQIAAASPLSEAKAALLVGLIRGSARYRRDPGLFPDVETKVNSFINSSNITGKHLSALADEIDALGKGTVAIKGGGKGVDYSKARDREALIDQAMGLMYDLASSQAFFGGSALIYNQGEF